MTSRFECFTRKADFFQTEVLRMSHQLGWLEAPMACQNANRHIGINRIRKALWIRWERRRAKQQKRRIA